MIKPLDGNQGGRPQPCSGRTVLHRPADMGADIIKVQSLIGGNIARQRSPFENDRFPSARRPLP